MSELLDDNIQLVENITMRDKSDAYLKRQPMPGMSALYFITPTVESVNRFLFDYRNRKSPMYGPVHLFFTSRLSDALLSKIKQSPAIEKVSSFKELNVEFILEEENMLTLKAPHALPALFKPEESTADSDLKQQEFYRFASQIATLCASLGENPHIRHDNKQVATSVAAILQEKLDDMAGPGSSFPSRILPDSQRPTLLLLDRSFDPLTPLLHEFTYQAMTHDQLSVQDGRYVYSYVNNSNQTVTKEVLLNETDPLWKRTRHMHLADLTTLLHKEYKDFIRANKDTANLKKGSDQDLKSLSAGIKGMPKFQEETARYSLHISITSELVRKYNEGSQEKIAMLEQDMATGETKDKKPHKTALADLKALLQLNDLPSPLSAEDKMRLLMIYVITQDGIKSEERRQLMSLANISPEDQLTILNLVNLGVTMMQGTKKKVPKKGAHLAEATYDVSRYVPPLKRLLEDAFSSGLSTTDYPFTRQPSASPDDVQVNDGSRRQAKLAASTGSTAVVTSRRMIVFILGGATQSEARSIHEVTKSLGREIILGSTSMLTPSSYLTSLKQLRKADAF
eukprot:CAMPEP_0181195132 /NCGR_PEP_ID=MMETSP1096-20121128/14712_1 /TAXON_ID=156174 ORGANISM="Chrysochromulina ericina, Strain CCMP281" /NCGR_SAMPLE_ID=MMETSP1096 /ASSEMBLY_ACC=CAM_ASM_000453 /LENGTH=566 /DNA_ID=CAMNT_0023284691 /DNA_START=96 /DNA_END=1796 /DNA_ORIENTATION=+